MNIHNIPKKPLSFLLYVLKPHWKWAIAAIVLVITASALGQSTSYFFKLIVDAVEVGDINAVLFWGMLYPVAVFVVQILFRASGITGGILSNKTSKTGVDLVSEYTFNHSHSYFSDRFAGSIVNKIRNVTHAIEQTIPDFLWMHINALVAFITTFILISVVDLYSGLLFLILLFVLISINASLAPKKALLSKANAAAGTEVQARLNDVVSGMQAVRQYTNTTNELLEVKNRTTHRKETGINSWFFTEKMLLINTFIIFIFALGIFWILISRLQTGAITTGDFVLVLALISQITGTMLFIGRTFNTTAKTIGELREALEEILLPWEIIDSDNAEELLVQDATIDFKEVYFTYNQEELFSDFTISIPARHKIGLVGRSGAGKSTFMSLLLRQHEIQSGVISINKTPIKNVTQESLRSNIAVIPQEPILFHRTIYENIAYGNHTINKEAVFEAAKSAYIHDFIQSLEQGYETMVGERGVKLSAGQKQRIAIARALLKNAPILVLDEATSALDSESEIEIQKALRNLMRGKTVIAIAHRLSTLREMDMIYVLDDGTILQSGTHNELKNKQGMYKTLWEHQTDGFLLD